MQSVAEQIIERPSDFDANEIIDVIDQLEDDYREDELHDILIEELERRDETVDDDYHFSHDPILG
ncbi:hypothetical protein [Halolamina salifodinae]|uniref:Uncharacterized protein n=1 Tax=Halolamina salifodinae TaxID=1202767 RepID=A0A8T4GZK0_9EURY|nr:hypothetical protein [Halolamina salifodinae]MBP1986974.1 hypothetical protein [Halolamina salifodinae]